jgi:hypothetical protein
MRSNDIYALVVVPKEGGVVTEEIEMDWIGPVIAKWVCGLEDDLIEAEWPSGM